MISDHNDADFEEKVKQVSAESEGERTSAGRSLSFLGAAFIFRGNGFILSKQGWVVLKQQLRNSHPQLIRIEGT